MANNEFRQDLYFRLNVARVHLPPLRERKEDIPLLIDHFVQKFSAQFGRGIEGFTDEAMERLLSYDWPGNIRELTNLIERIFIDPPAEKIHISDLPESIHSTRPSRPGNLTGRTRAPTLHPVANQLEQKPGRRATPLVSYDAIPQNCKVSHQREHN